jgi:hypothetical protein
MSDIDYKEEIRSAKAIIERWPSDKKSSVRLEGTDKYFDQQQRACTSQDYQSKLNQKNKDF